MPSVKFYHIRWMTFSLYFSAFLRHWTISLSYSSSHWLLLPIDTADVQVFVDHTTDRVCMCVVYVTLSLFNPTKKVDPHRQTLVGRPSRNCPLLRTTMCFRQHANSIF